VKVLHIIASPRERKSNTLRISEVFLEGLSAAVPDMSVDVVDLYRQDLPAVAGTNIDVKYSLMIGQPIDKEYERSWRQIETLIEGFMAADVCLISSPMWNFGIPYALKYYIDCLVQPGYVFKYDEQGRPVPLVHGKRLVCVTSRGGDYSARSPLAVYDFQEPYLRAIFGFIGVTEAHFVNAEPMDVSPVLREAALDDALARVATLVADVDWARPSLAALAEPSPTA
jgi:FMN-dependent NADH-azoreductase